MDERKPYSLTLQFNSHYLLKLAINYYELINDDAGHLHDDLPHLLSCTMDYLCSFLRTHTDDSYDTLLESEDDEIEIWRSFFRKCREAERIIEELWQEMNDRWAKQENTAMRMFYLNRIVDVSGVSGTGIVAEGVVFSDGKVALRFFTNGGSTGIYDSIEAIERIHGHGGHTKIRWFGSEEKPGE